MDVSAKIERLRAFQVLIREYSGGRAQGNRRIAELSSDELQELRSKINQKIDWVRTQVIEAGCFQTVTIGPPPAIGGLIAENVDPFGSMFNPPYRQNLFPLIIDMVDRTIGSLDSKTDAPPVPTVQISTRKNFAFVAMALNEDRPELADLLDAIKEATKRCGIQAERIDDEKRNEPITDRILESIRVAEHVIVDLSDERPNVFFEAGFAHGLGKIPIYVARHGTKLHFDLKDYPVIFFKGYKQLKDDLEARLRAIADRKTK